MEKIMRKTNDRTLADSELDVVTGGMLGLDWGVSKAPDVINWVWVAQQMIGDPR
jgi:hypothetical protein